jgi:hypothetical protein
MITANQLVAHAVGDYLLQSEWMVREKGHSNVAALAHVVVYTLPFLFLTQHPVTLFVIAGSHFVLDRWRVARYVIWLKNWPWPGRRSWEECKETGYPPETPKWMATWLMIIVDNILHVLINGAAITFIG